MRKETQEKGERQMSRNNSRINSLLVGLLVAALSVPALAQSSYFPIYQAGPQANGTYVAGDGTIINPAGTQVNLGIRVRAKSLALNPTGNHTAAVKTMGASTAVQVFNTQTGAVLQTYKPFGDSSGSFTGITYTPNGQYLLFTQDSSYVAIASVNSSGLLSDYAHVLVPMDIDTNGYLTTVTCFPNSPPGTTGSAAIPCGQTVTLQSDGVKSSEPATIAVSPDNKTAYVVLTTNNTLTKIDLTANPPVQVAEIRVGNVPHSVVISSDGTTAYVSNEAGRIATANDFQEYSNGVPVVAVNPTGATATGTISVVNLSTFSVTGTINTDPHPTGMAWWGKYLLVANAYNDELSVIATSSNAVVRKISLPLPIRVPGANQAAFGAEPNAIAVDGTNNFAYVALYTANAIAVVNLNPGVMSPLMGMIPVGYAPSSVVLDTTDNALLVANDKGIGTTGVPPTNNGVTNSFGCYWNVCDLNTHQDLGTVSIVPIPNSSALVSMTQQVVQNNHWDLALNISSASGGKLSTKPVAIPAKVGDPSLIKHVFVIIRENRTYDQILGDVAAGNGDPALAVFGSNSSNGYGNVTPNAHVLVQRFPLLDNFYDPSRQSADGHNWILQSMAPYHDDIQSPDWLRDYPSNGGDSIAYQKAGNLYNLAAKAGIKMKNYGEYIEYNTFLTPDGSTNEPSWSQFYADTLAYESGAEPQLYYYNTVSSHSPLPDVINHTVNNYPQFDLGIPDQFRVDIWKQDFAADVAAGTVPQLSFIWISSDHTGGPPTGQAMQADNDLALGRYVDIISHSPIWSSSAIFVEEDDAQNGVDHVDGHRSPGYVVSPYVKQGGFPDTACSTTGVFVDSHFYTQVSMNRTIENILGLTPMNEFDLVTSPMRTFFCDNPPATNFQAWTHVPNDIPLDQGVTTGQVKTDSPVVAALRAGWLNKKTEIFKGKLTKPDSEDPDTVNHLDWYEATGFTRPYPGEKTVRPATEFNRPAPAADDDDD
jgi:YVTN family beta-propeller protein